MNKKKMSEEEIQKMMSVFENMQPIPSNPWLYTRVAEQIKREKESAQSILQPRLQWAFAVLLVLLNAAYFRSVKLSSSNTNFSQSIASYYKSTNESVYQNY